MQRPCLVPALLAVTLLTASAARARSIEDAAYLAERRLVAMLRAMRPELRQERERNVAILQEYGQVSIPTGHAIRKQYLERLQVVQRLFGRPFTPAMARLVEPELRKTREEALGVILDPNSYSDEILVGQEEDVAREIAEYGVAETVTVQQRVQELVAEVASLWKHPLPTILARSPQRARAVRDLEEVDEYMRRLGLIKEKDRFGRADLARSVGAEVRAFLTPSADRDTIAYNMLLGDTLSSQEKNCLRAVNRYRAMMGLSVLELDLRLIVAARGHGLEMRRQRYFSHVSPNPGRRTATKRAQMEGFTGTVSENLALGPATGPAVVEAWLESPSHHQTLLDPDRTLTGIGHVPGGARVPHLWCMLYGQGEGFQAADKPPRYVYLLHAMSMDDDDPEAHFQLALYCYRHGLARYMEWECRATLRKNPDHAGARRLLGEVLSPEGDWVKRDG